MASSVIAYIYPLQWYLKLKGSIMMHQGERVLCCSENAKLWMLFFRNSCESTVGPTTSLVTFGKANLGKLLAIWFCCCSLNGLAHISTYTSTEILLHILYLAWEA